MESFGERLRRLRLGEVWTQEDLAGHSGVPVVTISRLETGWEGQSPRPSTVKRLANALGVSARYLMFGEDINDSKLAA
jgi:transcriptional regulator with XRE-family HTH domain